MSLCFRERFLPSISGRALEVKGWKVKFLKLNLEIEREAQELLMQMAREKRADVLLISKQYKWYKNSAWYQIASKTASIRVCNPEYSIRDSLETDAGFV